MAEHQDSYSNDLDKIAVANGCTEVAAFDLSRGSGHLPCLHYRRIGNQPSEAEKRGAIEGMEKIAKVFIATCQDAFVEIVGLSNSTAPIYGLLIFARRSGTPVGVAVFVKQCTTPAIAQQALRQLQAQSQRFREGTSSNL